MNNIELKFYDSKGGIYKPDSLDQVSFRPGVYVFVENNDGEILMIVDEKSNQWELPGGGLDIGEDLTECAVREVKEETGYNAKLTSEDPFYIGKEMAFHASKDKFFHGINFFFLAELESEIQEEQDFAEDENILEVEFFEKDKLGELDIVWFQEEAVGLFLNK